MKGVTTCERWGALWRSDGERAHVMYDKGNPALFCSRKEAVTWIKANYGYIGKRPDLRREPHGWRVPIPVRVKVTMRPTSTRTSK